jgi:hypothetical protein
LVLDPQVLNHLYQNWLKMDQSVSTENASEAGKPSVVVEWWIRDGQFKLLLSQAGFRLGPGSKFLGTNLDSSEANWILELDPALDSSLHLGCPNHELSLELFFGGLETIDFPSKMVPCGFSLNLPLFGLGPHLKALGPIYGSQWLGSFYFIGPWTVDPHLKWPAFLNVI